MLNTLEGILKQDNFSSSDIVKLLSSDGEARTLLFRKSAEVKEKYIGRKVWFRGLIEFSNVCGKDCLYCGIRKGNRNLVRYNLTDDEVLEAARFAYVNRYGSIALQSGELESPSVTGRIENLLHKIKELSNGELGITLSVGEQTPEVYKRWFDAGAHRYLLRVESTNETLYRKIHPGDIKHSFSRRMACLKYLQDIGYQTGTGVMIGLPFQTLEDLAGDLLFMEEFDIDMCGMGPYIEHADTPLIKHSGSLLPLKERFDLTLKMIAIIRIMMKDINIVAATALQAIDPIGREKAVKIGANIVMPNITPGKYRDSYKLYDNKPCTDDSAEDCQSCLEARISLADAEVIYGEWGDAIHYKKRLEG
ncbi:MAG: [FeFe] hydrogenase H-cluster radical SAM maturase HydE [Bacteroidetes bacterium GWE2_41_25]|nr:MAG: [FeFe] hydrogenase H-cluster radical SAM maturase HydE [Bacteroidetes bacterium GWA2_40_15]OFX90390.1 MAG: [FeFe] hydrogenase H-cluster radical SAM maturase HydE [Bacteroidetes bacterium GWC2_40_22]OFY04850.1 MAG: [FeFe] hydrogenase H-cluster radical SAM maturase HydE [Bacteroidetes bacterium GWE2_41_25]OFY57140.1 MAG: [FeFe] hydrogenase H-cluster radical SAM maturase HydE [Bacteroidetes bacterium GWF2_41_9]HAM10663.1 [FeFe] hydrogenase H-cluster radical SAM maturase HydE [Bacteroidales